MSEAAPIESNVLRGRHVLVVEDEYMIAQEIVEVLVAAGAEPLGPVSNVTAAMNLIASEVQIDAALLDVNLHNEAVWPVADKLLKRAVPVVLTTGYEASAIPSAYAGLPRHEKPTTGQELTRALVQALNIARFAT